MNNLELRGAVKDAFRLAKQMRANSASHPPVRETLPVSPDHVVLDTADRAKGGRQGLGLITPRPLPLSLNMRFPEKDVPGPSKMQRILRSKTVEVPVGQLIELPQDVKAANRLQLAIQNMHPRQDTVIFREGDHVEMVDFDPSKLSPTMKKAVEVYRTSRCSDFEPTINEAASQTSAEVARSFRGLIDAQNRKLKRGTRI